MNGLGPQLAPNRSDLAVFIRFSLSLLVSGMSAGSAAGALGLTADGRLKGVFVILYL